MSKKKAKEIEPTKRHKSGFRGPSPDVGKATQFKPGNNANPDGRPKTKFFTDAIRKILEKEPEQLEKIARAMLKKVRAGSVKHFTAVADRVEGKPVQPIEGTGEGGAFTFQIVNHVPRPKHDTNGTS